MKHATLHARLFAPFLPFAGLLVMLLGASLSGCYSKSTGNGGKFVFAYAAGLQFENFVKPIAAGAKLDVVAFGNDEEEMLTITAAKSSKPGVLAIDSVAGKKLVVKGIAPGVADLEITARNEAGETLVDRMFFHVEKPTVHTLQHACSDGPEAIYVQGSSVNIFHGLATGEGRPVIGYAYMPIRVEPATALSLLAQPQGANVYMFRAAEKKERVTIRSAVDSSALSLRIVARDELKEASLDCADCRTFEGYSLYVGAEVRFGNTPVCNQDALTKARSLTPEICTVTAKLEDGDGQDSNRDQLAVVKGLKFGICKYELTLPELDGGKGIKLAGEAQIGRMQFPRERERDSQKAERLERVSVSTLVAHTALPWFLVGLGWLAPNVIVLACMAWARRRRARRARATTA